MEHVIDSLVASTEVDWDGAHDTSPEIFAEQRQEVMPATVDTSKNAVSLAEGQDTSIGGKIGVNSTKAVNQIRIVDKNFPDKKTGFIALERDNFEFIGPDRQEVCIDSIDKCLKISRIIRDTNEPNYKIARFPLKSGLNLRAWEDRLSDYPDKRVINYLKFGFPLSLVSHEGLNNKDVTNHYSALAYPQAVQAYLDKEVALGAMLGPLYEIHAEEIHCSPLMTRPKDVDKRRVIFDLSYPRGASLNDHVDRNRFDNRNFALKLTCIDDIVRDISNASDPVLFKVDVARAFRNLRVDPADCIKFGIKWEGSYYLDGAVAFG